MVSEHHLKQSFGKVKQDIEGVKDELADALRRITKLETVLMKQALIGKSKKRN